MSKRVSRKNNKKPVNVILDKSFIEGVVYYANFIFTLEDKHKREYQTAFTLRNKDSRIISVQKRIKIDVGKLVGIRIENIKILGSYEPRKRI